jgi:uncharacterized protein
VGQSTFQQLNSCWIASIRVGLPWSRLLGYLRISTNPRAFAGAIKMRDAWNRVDSWLASQTVWIPEPTERHAEVLGQLLSQPGAHGDLVSDAHLAASLSNMAGRCARRTAHAFAT